MPVLHWLLAAIQGPNRMCHFAKTMAGESKAKHCSAYPLEACKSTIGEGMAWKEALEEELQESTCIIQLVS
jgi:hypothetical protein